jgi:hypothetical protein
MITSNHEGIKRNELIIVRVGKIIINPRTVVIMRRRIIMLERVREKDVR